MAAQNNYLAAQYRARRAITDVDPDTGEDVAPDEPPVAAQPPVPTGTV